MLTSNKVWVTALGEKKWLHEIDHQHFSNILWFMEVLGEPQFYRGTYNEMSDELKQRFKERLPWRPLPIPGEIKELVSRGLVTVNGDIYGNTGTTLHNGRIIGSLTHIENWQKMI